MSFDGRPCELLAFLAGPSEDGTTVVADDIFDRFGNGDQRLAPNRYIESNRAYLDELARVSGCEIKDLIGIRKDGRYWCVHQVAINYARWISPRLAVAFDAALIAFARDSLAKSYDWLEKRAAGTDTHRLLSNVIDKEVDDPPWARKKGAKYGVITKALQAPLNVAQGLPADTATAKKVKGVQAAMDAWDTPWLHAGNLSRSVLAVNIPKKKLRDAGKAADEAAAIATAYAELTKKLLAS